MQELGAHPRPAESELRTCICRIPQVTHGYVRIWETGLRSMWAAPSPFQRLPLGSSFHSLIGVLVWKFPSPWSKHTGPAVPLPH